VKKITYLVILAFLCLVLIPVAADASTGKKITRKETTSSTTQQGGTIQYGQAYGNTTSENFQYAWTTGLLLNQSILQYLQVTAPATSVAVLLNQFNSVGSELILTGAGGTSNNNGAGWVDDPHQYTLAEIQSIANGYAVGERGGVQNEVSNSITVGTDVQTSTSTSSVGHRITQTTNVNYGNVNYNLYNVSAERYVSPLVLDMTGKGVIEASKGKYLPHRSMDLTNAMLVDFYNNGFEVAMEWVGPNDGLLVAPKADGTVDATCLFGTAGGFDSGYEKLSLYDRNNDKAVSGDELNGLSIWQDKNQNGAVDNSEMVSCKDAGITSMSLKNQNFVGSFVRNGKTFKMWDWWPTALELSKVKK